MKAVRIGMVLLFCLCLLFGCSTVSEKKAGNTFQTEESDALQTESGEPAVPEFTGEEPVRPYHPTKNQGSAKALLGDVAVVSIFLDDPESTVSPQIQNEALTNITKAGAWLTEEAKKRGKNMRLITGKEDPLLVLNYRSQKIIGDADSSSFSYDDILELMKECELETVYNMVSEKYSTDNIAVVFVCNKNGRSFAYPGSSDEPTESLLSGAASPEDFTYIDCCFVYTMINWEPNSSFLYVHELLHLFGAIDLYFDLIVTDSRLQAAKEEQSRLAETYFPYEIMRSTVESTYEVGDLTAYLVGWEDTVPVKYAYFLD